MTAAAERERWQRLGSLLERALDLAAAERAAFLDRECEGEAALRRDVEDLLAADARPGGALDAPPEWLEKPGGALDAQAAWSRADRQRAATGDGDRQAAERDESGARIGAYRLVRPIGRGGMGAVYLAERADGQFAQRVALKLVRETFGSATVERRFRREREILAGLEHPNIGRLYDGGVAADGRPYFVMEHVEGEDLLAFCDRRRLPVRQRLQLFREVCAAVSFAHAKLVVHRDLKPSNILVTPAGVPKLLDFGLAKLLDAEAGGRAAEVTRAGEHFLTPAYASPEHWRGEAVTTTSDVYSLGVVLYQLLTGRHPWPTAAARVELLAGGAAAAPTKPSGAAAGDGRVGAAEELAAARGTTSRRLRRTLAGDLDGIVLTALQADSARRYPSAEALSADIDRHLAGRPVSTAPPTAGYRARRFVARHRRGVAAAAVALLVLAVLAGFYTVRLRRERDRAQREARKAAQVAVFLADLFELSDPQRARGRDLTAREILDRGARQVEGALAGQPELQAEMLTLIGRVYYRLGMLAEARDVLTLAVVRSRAANVGDSVAVAELLRQLGVALQDTGDLEQAGRRLHEAEAIFRRHRDRAGQASALTDLGNLDRWTGHYGRARRRFEEGLAITYTLGGEYDYLLSRQLHDLGLTLWRLHELAAARDALRRAQALDEKRYGPDSPAVAFNLATLALVEADAGNAAAALPLAERSLAIRRQTFGERHFQVAATHNLLGTVWWRQGDRRRAREHYDRSVALYEATLGEAVDLTWPLRQRCRLRVEQGEAKAALPDCRRALAIRQRAFAAGHPEVAVSTIDLLRARFAAGDRAGLESPCRGALEVLRGRLPTGHPRLVEAERLLADLLAAPGG
jgi:serine/threonine-protein kinase